MQFTYEQIKEILENNFKGRYIITRNWTTPEGRGDLKGTIDSTVFYIEYNIDRLCISVQDDNPRLLDLLANAFNILINKDAIVSRHTHGPKDNTFASYDLIMPTNTMALDEQIRNNFYNNQIRNLTYIFPNDYRVWGEFNPFDINIDNYPEVQIFLAINEYQRMLFEYGARRSTHKEEYADIPLNIGEIMLMKYALEYLIHSTEKYGVHFNKDLSQTEYVERSEEYKTWHSFWQKHFGSLSTEEYTTFLNALHNGEDISQFLPKENWQSFLPEQPKM